MGLELNENQRNLKGDVFTMLWGKFFEKRIPRLG